MTARALKFAVIRRLANVKRIRACHALRHSTALVIESATADSATPRAKKRAVMATTPVEMTVCVRHLQHNAMTKRPALVIKSASAVNAAKMVLYVLMQTIA